MTTNRLNAESAGFLPPEYNSEQLRYELNRIHKRIDDLLAQGIQTIKAVRVDRGPVELDSSPSVLECDTAVVAIDVQLPLAADMIPFVVYGVKDVGGLAATRNIVAYTHPGETIDGASSKTISSNYGKFLFYSDGFQLFTISG